MLNDNNICYYLHGTLTPRTNQRAQVVEMDQSDCKKLLPHVATNSSYPPHKKKKKKNRFRNAM